eukprot:IDg10520t1
MEILDAAWFVSKFITWNERLYSYTRLRRTSALLNLSIAAGLVQKKMYSGFDEHVHAIPEYFGHLRRMLSKDRWTQSLSNGPVGGPLLVLRWGMQMPKRLLKSCWKRPISLVSVAIALRSRVGYCRLYRPVAALDESVVLDLHVGMRVRRESRCSLA